ncbi:hypothetical protein KCV01_g15937, partial [Aureobasidium melanogenum]
MGVGPFPLVAVLTAVAFFIAWLVAKLLGRKEGAQASSFILDAMFLGVVSARIAFVLRWWRDYVDSPVSIITIADGGFFWQVGVAVAAVFLWSRSRQAPATRRPAFVALAVGLLAWFGLDAAMAHMRESAQPLPAFTVSTPDGHPVDLASFRGRPVVVNVWATWCPPCRREMPVFRKASEAFPGVAFLMLNQGEDIETVRGALATQPMGNAHVLLDPESRMMRDFGMQAVPGTFYFDAEGHLIDSHIGELTLAPLRTRLRRYFPSSNHDTNSKE